jgi:hypothetical protein
VGNEFSMRRQKVIFQDPTITFQKYRILGGSYDYRS